MGSVLILFESPPPMSHVSADCTKLTGLSVSLLITFKNVEMRINFHLGSVYPLIKYSVAINFSQKQLRLIFHNIKDHPYHT